MVRLQQLLGALLVLLQALLLLPAHALTKRRYLRKKYTPAEHAEYLREAFAQMSGGEYVVIQPPEHNAQLGERRILAVTDTSRIQEPGVNIVECMKDARATCWLFGTESLPDLLLADRGDAHLQ